MVAIGKRCIEILNSVIKLMSQGDMEDASRQLLTLKTDGVNFAQKLQEIVKKQERLKSFFAKAEVNSKREITDCTHRVLELMEQHASLLSDLERNTVLSFHFKSKLDMSLDELSIVSQATKIISKEGSLRNKGTKDLLSYFSGEEDVKDEIYKKETQILSVVEHNRRQCRAAGVVLDTIRKKLKENKGKIIVLEDKLGELQRRKDGIHRKVLQIKQNIDFLDNALDFWSLMHLLSETGDNLEVMKVVADKATEKISLSSGSRATRRLASTFLEALESEMVQAEKGYSHVLSCGFHCEGCNTIRNTTPNIYGAMVLCTVCHESHKIKL